MNLSILFLIIPLCEQGDVRRYIALSTFGFFKGGTLDVNLYNFRVDDGRDGELVSETDLFV